MTEARLRGLPCKSSAAWTPPLTIHSCGHMQVVLIESWWLIDIYKQGPNEPKDNTSHLCTCVTDTCDQHLGKDSKGRAWAAFGNPTPTRPWELQTLMDPVLGIPWDPGERSFCEQGAMQLLQRQSPESCGHNTWSASHAWLQAQAATCQEPVTIVAKACALWKKYVY